LPAFRRYIPFDFSFGHSTPPQSLCLPIICSSPQLTFSEEALSTAPFVKEVSVPTNPAPFSSTFLKAFPAGKRCSRSTFTLSLNKTLLLSGGLYLLQLAEVMSASVSEILLNRRPFLPSFSRNVRIWRKGLIFTPSLLLGLWYREFSTWPDESAL